MKERLTQSRSILLLTAGVLLLSWTGAQAQSNVWWTGAASAVWSNSLNWISTNGAPGTVPGSGSGSGATKTLHFIATNTVPNLITNDINNCSLFTIFFDANGTGPGTNFTLYLKSGSGAPTLNDFSQSQPTVQNNSTNVQTVDMPFKLQSKGITTAANQYAAINPTSGDMIFTTNCGISLITNTQLRFFSTAGHTLTFFGPVTNSTGVTNACSLATTGTGGKGTTVIFYNTNSCTNIFINCGTLRLATNNVTSYPLTIGDTNSSVAPPAIVQLDNGFLNNSPIVIQTLQVSSTNSRTIGNSTVGTGTAQFIGPITLGTNLTTLANTAGTLEFDGNIDFQNPSGTASRILTVSGSGNTLITGSFTNASTGVSVLTKTNSGTLTLAGTNAVRVLYNHGGGVISITNAGAIGVPTGVNYPDKFNFTASATLSVTNSFTLGRNAGGSDNAGFRINGGSTGTFDVAANSALTIDGPIIDLPATGSGNLAKTSAGTLILQQPNTYSGSTTIGAGTLAVAGSGSLSSTNLAIGAGATFDVSALSSTFALGSSQTLSGSGATGTIVGNVNMSSGALAISYTNGTPTLQITSGTLSFNNNTVTVTVSGTQLPAGSYKLIAAGTGGSVSGSVSSSAVTVAGAGSAAGAQNTLKISGGALYLVVNHPPVANGVTYSRNAGIPTLKIALTDLATNWSDPDNDSISLISVGTSTNGVTLSTNSANIFYNNSNNVNDQFNYVIADAQGAMATGLVTITVSATASGQVRSFAVVSGSPSLAFAGIPTYTYNIQRSTNLVDWPTIWTTNAPSGGLFSFVDYFADLGSNAPSSAYYRLSWQP